ncbi:hypothetical protein DC008_25805 [Streptomyces nigra]|nr:hypothetical protein DC008_25805 [Streptomyces nigra]
MLFSSRFSMVLRMRRPVIHQVTMARKRSRSVATRYPSRPLSSLLRGYPSPHQSHTGATT